MSEKVNLKARDLSLDVMKGFAMLLVIIQHSVPQIVDSNWGGVIVMDVPLFFLVSGFLAYKSDIDVKSNLWKKIRYILLPFVCAIIFSSLISGLSLREIISRIDKCGYWFLQSLFIIFIVYYFIFKSFKNIKYWLPLIIIIELLLLAASKFLPETIDNYIGFSSLCRYFPCFICGVIVKKYCDDNFRPSIVLLFICLIIAVLPFINIEFHNDLSFIISVISYSDGAILLFFFIKTKCNRLPQIVIKILTAIGKYSVVVYLIHFYLIPHFPQIESLNSTILILPAIVVAIFIAFLCILISKMLTFATPLKYILPK